MTASTGIIDHGPPAPAGGGGRSSSSLKGTLIILACLIALLSLSSGPYELNNQQEFAAVRQSPSAPLLHEAAAAVRVEAETNVVAAGTTGGGAGSSSPDSSSARDRAVGVEENSANPDSGGGGGGDRRFNASLLRLRESTKPKRFPPFCNQGRLKDWRPGKCAEDNAWLIPWMHQRPKADWTVVDVGANKGYVIAEWLEALLEDQTFTATQLGIHIFSNMSGKVKKGFMGLCGGCCECVDAPSRMPTSIKAKSVKVYAYEPSIANYNWLKSFFVDTSIVNLTNAAVSATPGTAYFPKEEFGVETGKVLDHPHPGYVPVSIVTLDEHLKDVPFIHILSTDAEGFDQEVAKGARSFLSQGRVGVYQFEMYKEMDYKPVFDQLEKWGYVCWFATASRKIRVRSDTDKSRLKKWVFAQMRRHKLTKTEALHPLVPRLVRITGCWEEAYNSYHGWVNGLCHNAQLPELNAIFNNLSRQKWRRAGGNCDAKATQVTMVDSFIKKHISPLGVKIGGVSLLNESAGNSAPIRREPNE